MKITVNNLTKLFAEKKIFKDINFEVKSGQSIAITGPNGSGKTTLIRILCGLIRPSEGSVIYSDGNQILVEDQIFKHIGLVGPYLELYEELTAFENMSFFSRIRGTKDKDNRITQLIDRVGLHGREDDPVRTYSSGMRQRLKYVFALLHNPQVLFLDEPTSNLDTDGTSIVNEIMNEQKKDKLLIIATNEQNELKYGDFQIAIAP
jgi:heme exporter protein A